MILRDVHDEAPGGAWVGLEIVLSGAPRRPPLHVQAGAGHFLRLAAGPSPLLWARITADHYGYWVLRSAAPTAGSHHVVPPITAPAARAIEEAPESPGWYAAWARVFLRELVASPRSPLHSGSWLLAPCSTEGAREVRSRSLGAAWPRVPPAVELERTLAQGPQGFMDWDLHDVPPLALRPASGADDGRVKAFRKALREGQLAPVLLMWVTGLCAYVVLDGHSRLAAALLEGRSPPMLALLCGRDVPPSDDVARRQAVALEVAAQLVGPDATRAPRGRALCVESANRLLIEAYDERPRMSWTTTAWPLAGGVSVWLAEVGEALRRLPTGAESDPGMDAP